MRWGRVGCVDISDMARSCLSFIYGSFAEVLDRPNQSPELGWETIGIEFMRDLRLPTCSEVRKPSCVYFRPEPTPSQLTRDPLTGLKSAVSLEKCQKPNLPGYQPLRILGTQDSWGTEVLSLLYVLGGLYDWWLQVSQCQE